MAESYVEEIISSFMELKLPNSAEQINESLLRGDMVEIETIFSETIEIIDEKSVELRKMVDKLKKIRDSTNQDTFWSSLSENEYSPTVLSALCSVLISKNDAIRHSTAAMYSILLGMKPLTLIWNPILFNTLLSIMISASQIIESTKKPADDEMNNIVIAKDVLENLSDAMCQQLTSLIGNDGIIALIELSVKLSYGYSSDFDQINQMIKPVIYRFLSAAACTHLENVIPFVVSALLLEFLPSNKKVTQRVSSIRQFYIEFLIEKVEGNQRLLYLSMQHLLMRCPDRSVNRESIAYTVSKLITQLNDKSQFMTFVSRMLRSQKTIHKILAMELSQSFLFESEMAEFISEDSLIDIVKSSYACLSDSVATVRANALDFISSLLSKMSDIPFANEISHILEIPNGLIQKLERRIVDEKLNVRKSAIRCVHELANSILEEPYELLRLIADRSRDRSVSLRQESINLLSSAVKSIKGTRMFEIWFDSVIPLALDSDNKTQDLALKQIDECFISRIPTEIGYEMVKSLNSSHIEYFRRIFPVFKQKAINLSPFCQIVQSSLSIESPENMWKMASCLFRVTPQHFKIKKILGFWPQRNELPISFLEMVSLITIKEKAIIQDCIRDIDNIVDNIANLSELMLYSWIHYHIQIIYRSGDSYSYDQLFEILVSKINWAVENQDASTNGLIKLIPALFIIGEIIPYVSSAKDYDFTGTQLLLSSKLPNGIMIPSSVRSIASITLGKLCLNRRDISSSFVAAFANQLYTSKDPAVKCNCLVVLCDLCVKYTSTVDPYVQEMTSCFVDSSPIVRRQALLILTRLITEDFVKMRPLMFFRFVSALIDKNQGVASFAKSCLFDVLNIKNPRLISSNFIDSLYYFNDLIEPVAISEDPSFHDVFIIKDPLDKRKAFTLMISQMSDSQLFDILQSLCVKVLQGFIDDKLPLEEGEALLSDTFFVMFQIEDQMEAINLTEANVDDVEKEAIAEQSRKVLSLVHNQLIQKVLPILNNMNRLLRRSHSPLQSDLRAFFKRLCEKHSSLIDELKRQEPILATEIQHDLASSTPLIGTQSPPPQSSTLPFKSPLLSRIINTPNMTLFTPSSNASPMSRLTMYNSDPRKKKDPIPFNLDED